MNLQTYCEVSPEILTRKTKMVRIRLPESSKPDIGELYKILRKCKNKAERGAALRLIVPWTDIPADIWEMLEESFPTEKPKQLLQELRG